MFPYLKKDDPSIHGLKYPWQSLEQKPSRYWDIPVLGEGAPGLYPKLNTVLIHWCENSQIDLTSHILCLLINIDAWIDEKWANYNKAKIENI